MSTVEELRLLLGVDDDEKLGKIFGVTRQAVSKWRANGVPSKVELRARDIIGHGSMTPIITGSNNHIDFHGVAEPQSNDYSPATATLLDILKDWSEKKRRVLLGRAIEMNGDEPEEA